MQLKIVANVHDQSGGIYHASYSLGLVLHLTGAPEVACGGSQHLPLAQQEHTLLCNSLLTSEEGVLLMFQINNKK